MKCYAAFAKDLTIRNSGSSGGLFPLLSLKFIQNGGVVYASEYDDSFQVVFNRYTSSDTLKRSFTSKYVQSRLNNTFLYIKKDLKNHLPVLFCGTPCQVSALAKYLELTKTPTDTLLLLDFVCHGVPSETVFQHFMKRFSNPPCVELNMRNKDSGWDYGCYSWKLSFSDSTTLTIQQNNIPYMKGFLSNLFLRHSCYTCKKESYKAADITIGDFWGISKTRPDIPSKHGVSCVIVRSQKGVQVFEKLQKYLETYPVQYSDILISNPSLQSPAKKPFYRTLFFRKLQKGANLDTLIEKAATPTYKNRIINKLYSKLPFKPTSVGDLTSYTQHTIYTQKESCCGCVACYNICPVKAITLKTDSEGFVYPVITTSICTNCQLCRSICPCITS